MTDDEVLKLASSMNQRERHFIWEQVCPAPHKLENLQITNSGVPFCPNCLCLITPNGELLNQPRE
jgi:hypothetical protein